ncbi:hypothetical protein SKAU_G00059120 [Synaphobranchus kaupii]|uniref:Uncharacterized protein n=1 Tax=Synaphobranchus kaupii TaxID=118154 RepID=A0A9Q1JAK5_SYNKA|nr:hypothetical protein SKAU_G00059120 [Synaphobranchus kaupii]
MLNTLPSPTISEVEERWPFLLTQKGLCNHFPSLTGIDINHCLSKALLTKGKRIVKFFQSQKNKWDKDILKLLLELDGDVRGTSKDLTSIATILPIMKRFYKKEDSVFILADIFMRINPEDGTKCTATRGVSCKMGAAVKREVNIVNPHVTSFLQSLTEFEWKTQN